MIFANKQKQKTMTAESLKQGKLIQDALEKVTQAKRNLTAYINERVDLEITTKKGLLGYKADERTTQHFTLHCGDPLLVAITAALEGMREELQEQFDNLDSDLEPQKYAEDPITKTSWWHKAYRWIKPK